MPKKILIKINTNFLRVCRRHTATYVRIKTDFSKSPILAHLVELAGEFPGGHVELDEAVAGRQGHLVQVRGVPGAHDDPPVAGPGLDPVDNLRQLVHALAMENILIAIKIFDIFLSNKRTVAGTGPVRADLAGVVRVHVDVLRPEVSPLEAVDGAQVPFLALRQADAVQELPAAVSVPDPHVLLLKLLGARGAADEPEELLGNASIEDLLGCEERECSVPERVSHLGPEE